LLRSGKPEVGWGGVEDEIAVTDLAGLEAGVDGSWVAKRGALGCSRDDGRGSCGVDEQERRGKFIVVLPCVVGRRILENTSCVRDQGSLRVETGAVWRNRGVLVKPFCQDGKEVVSTRIAA